MLFAFIQMQLLGVTMITSCMKHSIGGDFNPVSVDDVTNRMDGDGTGRVQR